MNNEFFKHSARPLEIELIDCLNRILHRASLPLMFTANPSTDSFFSLFSALGWRFRRSVVFLDDEEVGLLTYLGLISSKEMNASDVARVYVLCSMLYNLPKKEHVGLVDALYRSGDNKEREVILKNLVLLPMPERFIATTIDSCRTAVQSTFEAIACDNTYPAQYFPNEAFRSLVLKAIHLGVCLRRVYGLYERMDNTLYQMVIDYTNERTIAKEPNFTDLSIINRWGRSRLPISK